MLTTSSQSTTTYLQLYCTTPHKSSSSKMRTMADCLIEQIENDFKQKEFVIQDFQLSEHHHHIYTWLMNEPITRGIILVSYTERRSWLVEVYCCIKIRQNTKRSHLFRGLNNIYSTGIFSILTFTPFDGESDKPVFKPTLKSRSGCKTYLFRR